MFYKTENLEKYSSLNCITYYKLYDTFPKLYSYQNVIESTQKLNELFNQCGVQSNTTIGLLFGHSPVIIPLILSILNRGNSFYFLSDDHLLGTAKDCQDRGIQYIIADSDINLDTLSIKILTIEKVNVLESDIKLIKIDRIQDLSLELTSNICYCVTTSGSTGQAKYVRVPFQCIMPNIESLIIKFKLNCTDTVVLISPTTFDPFIVDLFMGLTVGANILFLNNSLRLSHTILASFLFSVKECNATFMQCTPSYFKLFTIEQITNLVLSDSSSLKTLVLGGEKFPLLLEVKSWNTHKNIYNIYGITEVSCWATIEKWDSNQETTLGEPIDDTTIIEVKSGELYIGSANRICALDNEPISIISANKPILRSTGDLVEQRNGRYYFKGRRDDSIKRFGIKLNLTDVENTILNLIPEIIQIKLLFYNQTDLILFYKFKNANSTTSHKIQKILRKNLKSYEIPDELFEVNKFPLSHNGKLANRLLADLYCTKCKAQPTLQTACELFLTEVRTLWDCSEDKNKHRKVDMMSLSFLAHGGYSLMALNIVTKIESRLRISTPKLLTLLLDESKTINDSLIYLNQLKSQNDKFDEIISNTDSVTSSIILKVDLQKCIDSTPSINSINNKKILSIGSHSGIILNIELQHNKIISKLQLPDRIESEIVKFNDVFGIVGCYNGRLYCYNIITGEIAWSFDSGGMIKCKSLLVNNLILFGNYNPSFNFYCIDGVNGELNYKKMIGTKSIISNCVRYFDNFCIICTLDGTCEVFNSYDGIVKWCVKLSSPIFSTPVVINRRFILISEVEGILHYFDENGNEIWNFKTDSNIFSSFEIETITESLCYIYFGCYNRKLYCLEYNTDAADTIKLKWETNELKSPIYSTPKLIRLDEQSYVFVVATVGIIYLFDSKNVMVSHELQLPGEVFSTPAIITNNATNECNIAIGSRDNHLYLINFKSINKS